MKAKQQLQKEQDELNTRAREQANDLHCGLEKLLAYLASMETHRDIYNECAMGAEALKADLDKVIIFTNYLTSRARYVIMGEESLDD